LECSISFTNKNIPDPRFDLHSMGSCFGKNQQSNEETVRNEKSPLKDSNQKDMRYSTQEHVAPLVGDSHEVKFNWDSFWQKENERFN